MLTYDIEQGDIVFVSNDYFDKFCESHPRIQRSHEVDGKGGRPHYVGFIEETNPKVYWLVPMSKDRNKIHELHNNKHKETYKKKRNIKEFIAKHGYSKSVFIIKRMIPVTENYITRHMLNGEQPVVLEHNDNQKLRSYCRLAYNKYCKEENPKYLENDVFTIRKELTKELEQ